MQRRDNSLRYNKIKLYEEFKESQHYTHRKQKNRKYAEKEIMQISKRCRPNGAVNEVQWEKGWVGVQISHLPDGEHAICAHNMY